MKLSKFARLMFLSVFILLLGTMFVSAQGAMQYGQPLFGVSSEQAPVAFYSFNGTAGDRVEIGAKAVSPGMDLSVSLLSQRQEPMGFNDENPLPPESSDPVLYAILPESGTYSVLVGNVNGVYGDFLIYVNGTPLTLMTPLVPNQTTNLIFGPGGVLLEYNVQLNPQCASSLRVDSDVPVSVILRDQTYTPVGTASNMSSYVTFGLPASGELYSIYVFPIDNAAPGTGRLFLEQLCSAQSAPQSQQQTQPNTVPVQPNTSSSSSSGSSTTGACRVTAYNNTNMRTGPGTNFNIAGTLYGGSTENLQAQTTGTDGYIWYQLMVNSYWVRSDVVNREGDCSTLQTVGAPSSGSSSSSGSGATYTPIPTTMYTATPTGDYHPTVTYTPTYAGPTATYMPGTTPTYTTVPPTATYTPSYTPTATYTPSYTPTTENVAPPDTNYALQVPIDEGDRSISEYVSSPNGDTTDIVGISLTGIQNNINFGGTTLTFQFFCTGTGTENVTFTVSGSSYPCNGFVQFTPGYEQRGIYQVTITASGNAYVNWTVRANLVKN